MQSRTSNQRHKSSKYWCTIKVPRDSDTLISEEISTEENLSKKVVVSRSWSCVHWPMRRWLIWRAFLNAVLLLLCQAHQGWLILVPSKKIVIYKQWKDINNDSHSVCISPKRKKIHNSWRIYASKDIKSATQVSYLAPSNLSKDLMLEIDEVVGIGTLVPIRWTVFI